MNLRYYLLTFITEKEVYLFCLINIFISTFKIVPIIKRLLTSE